MSASAEPSADRTIVEFPATDGYRSVGRLVLGGIAARFELPIDRVDDLLLAVESLLLQGPVGDTVRIEAEATSSGLRVRLGSFRQNQLHDEALRRVIAPLVDEIDERADGETSSIELVVSAAYRDEGA
ncbi:MAG TPA: hypothetical protein VHH57_01435 [Gaiella sp.]|nr:hypothetical protein [Gaiella sp.]